jgi:hypothetical protein
MPRVVPSQVVELIDKLFPWAKDQREGDEKNYLSAGNVYSIGAVLDLLQHVPSELITLGPEDHAEFVSSVAALRTLMQRWQIRAEPFHRIPGMRQLSPITLIRQALAQCPDEFPSSDTQEFKFITDTALRESIRLDMSATNNALSNAEWKATTVLAGSLIEALLLWKIEQQNPAACSSAVAALGRKLDSDPQKWVLADYIDVTEHMNLIKPNTVTLCRVAKNFRNLIHPGRAQRLNQPCNRGTAMAAVSALEHVLQDL